MPTAISGSRYLKGSLRGRYILSGKGAPCGPALAGGVSLSPGCVIVSPQPWFDLDKTKCLLVGRVSALKKAAKWDRQPAEQVSAAEAVLRSWPDGPRSADGTFLLLSFDPSCGALTFTNCRYLATSLYYTRQGDAVFFADSLEGLLRLLPETPEMDPASIPTFLANGFSPSEKTQLTGVFRLLPAERLVLSGGKMSVDDYWGAEFAFERLEFGKTGPHLDRYEQVFSSGLRSALDGQTASGTGLQLSGGHDTSFTLIQASKILGPGLKTYTVSFAGWGFDEYPKAKFIADRFGAESARVVIDETALDHVPPLILAAEEPASGGTLPLHLCSEKAAGSVSMMLTGDGGDTLWGEYYPVAAWHSIVRHLPKAGRKLLLSAATLTADITDWERLRELEHVLSLFSPDDYYNGFFRRLCTYRHFGDGPMRALLSPGSFPDVSYNDCRIRIPFCRDNMHDALIEAKMLYGVYLYINGPMEKSLASCGLGYHTPYFNSELIEFINSLPEEWKNGGGLFRRLSNDAVKRRFHKEALLRHLPKRLVFSLQRSLDIPWHVLLKRRPAVLSTLLAALNKRGLYSAATLANLFSEFSAGVRKPHELVELEDHGYRIYSLLALEVWMRIFIDGRAGEARETMPLEEFLSIR